MPKFGPNMGVGRSWFTQALEFPDFRENQGKKSSLEKSGKNGAIREK